MAKHKAKKIKTISSKAVKKERLDPRIEEIYEKEVEFICPMRGLVKQKVKIKRFKSLMQTTTVHTVPTTDTLNELESQDDGLSQFAGNDEEVE